jgi:hypothetical protein
MKPDAGNEAKGGLVSYLFFCFFFLFLFPQNIFDFLPSSCLFFSFPFFSFLFIMLRLFRDIANNTL